jgi:hypothetical protein
MLYEIIGAISVCSFIYYTALIYLLRYKYKKIPGPPASSLFGFYLGNLIELMIEIKLRKRLINDVLLDWYMSHDLVCSYFVFNMITHLLKRINSYGKTIKFQVLNRIVIVTVDLQANKVI